MPAPIQETFSQPAAPIQRGPALASSAKLASRKYLQARRVIQSLFERSIVTIDRPTTNLTLDQVLQLFRTLPKLERVSALNGVWNRVVV